MASIARSLHIARPAALRLAPRATPAVVRSPFRAFSTTRMGTAFFFPVIY